MKARLVGEIPKVLEDYLQQKCLWVDPVNLANVIYLYADKIMHIGIMPKVKVFLEEAGYTVEIVRPELHTKHPNWVLNATPRPHQIPLIETGLRERYGFLQAPPGAGKTLVACAIIAKLGLPSIIVTQAGEPFQQAVASLERFTNIKPGKIGLDSLVDSVDQVYVITIQTFNKLRAGTKFHDIVKNAEVVIVDEAHHGVSDSYLKMYSTFTNVQVLLGLSATPWRDDDRHELLEGLIGPILHVVDYGDLIDSESLVPLTIYTARLPRKEYGYTAKMFSAESKHVTEFQRRSQFRKVYNDYVINNPVRHGIIAEFVSSMESQNMTTAVICKLIEHAEALHKVIPQAVVLTGKTKTKDRLEIIRKLQNHEISCVITTIFDEAVDIPSLGGVVFAAGGKSTVKAIQRLRSTRSFKGMVKWGYYHKKRGYALFLMDDADFLRTHSNQTLKVLKKEIAKHRENEIINV